MATDVERLARLEERWSDMRQDIADLRQADTRARDRLHKIEGVQGLLVADKQNRDAAIANRQKRLEDRIAVLTVVIAAATLLEPLIYHYIGAN